MSKVSNMLSLFEPKKNDQEKKAPIHADKIKPASSNSTTQKNDSLKNNNTLQSSNNNKPEKKNSIADRMNMFENKNKKNEEKKIPNKKQEKEEKKVENNINSNKDKKEDNNIIIKEKKVEKENQFEKKMSLENKNFLGKMTEKVLKENNEVKEKDKDNQIKRASTTLPDNKVNKIINKEENKNIIKILITIK